TPWSRPTTSRTRAISSTWAAATARCWRASCSATLTCRPRCSTCRPGWPRRRASWPSPGWPTAPASWPPASSTACPPAATSTCSGGCSWTGDDARAAGILRLVREAMAPDTRLVVIETVVDEAALETPYASVYNLSLMLYAGALRTEDEHRALLQDAGLRVRRVLPTASVITTLIEAERAD